MFLTFLGLDKLFSKVIYPLTTVSDGACHILSPLVRLTKIFIKLMAVKLSLWI